MSNTNEPNAQTDIWEAHAKMVHESHLSDLQKMADDVADRKHIIDACVNRLLGIQRDTNRVHDTLVFVRQQLENRDYERGVRNMTDASYVRQILDMRVASVIRDLSERPWSKRLAEKVASITEDKPASK